jgi:hypothetical protein
MSDINTGNFPPVVPISKANQYQKGFFPFAAFSADDPNVKDHPVLKLKSAWQFSAAHGLSSITSNCTVADDDGIDTLIATTDSATIAVSFASLTTKSAGRIFTIVKADAGSGSVNIAQTVSGVSVSLAAQYDSITILFDGTNLFKIGGN